MSRSRRNRFGDVVCTPSIELARTYVYLVKASRDMHETARAMLRREQNAAYIRTTAREVAGMAGRLRLAVLNLRGSADHDGLCRLVQRYIQEVRKGDM